MLVTLGRERDAKSTQSEKNNHILVNNLWQTLRKEEIKN